MNQFFARAVELREETYVKYERNITMDSPSREFLEMTNKKRKLFFKNPLTNFLKSCIIYPLPFEALDKR